jgi:hypothetical protein
MPTRTSRPIALAKRRPLENPLRLTFANPALMLS